jgi:hypothetical protein
LKRRSYASYKYERRDKLINEAYRLRNKGYKLKEIAEKMGLKYRQVTYIFYQLNNRR